MRKTRWTIWLALVLILCLSGVLVYWLYLVGHISHIRVSKTKDGWVCSGPIQYYLGYPKIRPILRGKKVVLVERYKREFYIEGFKIAEVKMSFPLDSYYITALSVYNGDVVYRRRMSIKGHPLQVVGIWPWRENVVVWGYYQEEADLDNRIGSITILDARGRIRKRFRLDLQPTAVDEKNNLLICGSRMLELPSGKEKFQVKLKLLIDMVTDKNGNVYIFRRTDQPSHDDKSSYDGYIEKYSVVPWKQLWSVKVTGRKGSPWMLKYQKDSLWYAFYDPKGGAVHWVDNLIWDGPLDTQDGTKIETDRKCDPYRLEAEFDGKEYVVTRVDDKLYIKTVSQ